MSKRYFLISAAVIIILIIVFLFLFKSSTNILPSDDYKFTNKSFEKTSLIEPKGNVSYNKGDYNNPNIYSSIN